MSSGIEPFPLFIESSPPEFANYFSQIDSSMQILSHSSAPTTRKPRASVSTKLSNYVRLRYYQYEVTFGLYMLNANEKFALNTVILVVASALLYALYWGLESFFIRSICSIVYHITGATDTASELCS